MWLTGIDLCTKRKTTADQRKRHVIKQFTGNWKQKHRGQQEARAAGRLEKDAARSLRGSEWGSQFRHTGRTTGWVTLWATVSTLNRLG